MKGNLTCCLKTLQWLVPQRSWEKTSILIRTHRPFPPQAMLVSWSLFHVTCSLTRHLLSIVPHVPRNHHSYFTLFSLPGTPVPPPPPPALLRCSPIPQDQHEVVPFAQRGVPEPPSLNAFFSFSSFRAQRSSQLMVACQHPRCHLGFNIHIF